LFPALQSGYYGITWERCADIPSPMYDISAVLHDKKMYIMAGDTPDDNTLYKVYCYHIATNQWEQLPLPGHRFGILQIIDGKLAVIGGQDITNINAMRATNKVSTFITDSWTNHFPNLLRARSKPGAVSHAEYVIVAGGQKDRNTINDDIEVLNTTQPSQWMMTSVLLPEPMWNIHPTISNKKILIVGSCTSTNRTTASYQLPVDKITASTTPGPTSNCPVQWMELPNAPYYYTSTIPNFHPPVIMGGYDGQYAPSSDIAMLDDGSNKWMIVSSLSSPRIAVAVVSIDSDTVFVLGGNTITGSVNAARGSSITVVEKGRATLTKKAAAVPLEGTQCSIQ